MSLFGAKTGAAIHAAEFATNQGIDDDGPAVPDDGNAHGVFVFVGGIRVQDGPMAEGASEMPGLGEDEDSQGTEQDDESEGNGSAGAVALLEDINHEPDTGKEGQ